MVGILPDRNSIIRLVAAVLAEHHDKWVNGRRYLVLQVLAKSRQVLITTTDDTKREPVLGAIGACQTTRDDETTYTTPFRPCLPRPFGG